MPTLTVSEEQVVDLLRQLPPRQKRRALLSLGNDARREALLDRGESRLRELCAQRGLDWDRMSEDDREAFVDDLLHEDVSCAS